METRHLIVEAYLHVLAFAMLCMGVISLGGYLLLEQVSPHSVVLLPDSALMAMLMGGLILAVTRQAMSAVKLLASLLGALTLYSLLHNQLAGGAEVGPSLLSGFQRMRSPLALTIFAATLALCLLFGTNLAKRGALLIGIGISLLAILSHLVESLPELSFMRLGFKHSASHVAHLFTLCLGLAIVLLALRPQTEPCLLDRRTLAAGGLGALLACSSWYLLSLQDTQTINRESAALLSKIDSSMTLEMNKHLASLQRMSERWEALGQLPEASFWQREAQSYLRDFPAFTLLTLLYPDLSPQLIEGRDTEQRQRLLHRLQDPAQQAWLSQLQRNGQMQIGPSHQQSQAGGPNALLVQPLRLPEQPPHLLVASLNIPALLREVLSDESHDFIVEIYENEQLLYSWGATNGVQPTAVGERSSQLPHGQTWRLVSHIDNLQVLHSTRHLSSLSLLLGLALTFFLVLSQRLAWLATAHTKQVQDSQQRFASLFSFNPNPVFSCDLAGHIRSVNTAGGTLLGRSAEALQGEPLNRLFGEDSQRLDEMFENACAGTPQHHSLRLQVSQTEARVLDITLLPIKVDKQIVGIFAIGKDITEQRAAAEQLRQSNLIMSMAGRSACLGSWALEIPSQHLIWSDEVRNLLEYPPGDPPPLEEGLNLYPIAVRPQISEALRACAEEGIAFDLELPVHTRSGRLLDARITAQPVHDEQGQITRMIGAFQDVSAHRHALRETQRLAERLRTTLESISDAFYTMDNQWRFTYINPEAERQLRVKACDILGQTLWEAFPGAYDSDIGEHYRQAMSSAQPCHFESFYPPFGRWYELHAYPSEEGIAVYFQDISQRRETQQELHATLQELERSNRELQEFAFVASHDLQEPLRKIQTFAERLGSRAEHLDSDSRDYLQRMTSAAARMQALINDLLNYSRLNTRAQPLQPLALDQVLDDVLQDMETVLEQSQARIERQPLPSLLGDASQLRQVLQNLLSNALKFQPSGNQPVIRLYVEEQDSSGWTLCIADNGIGFEEKYLDRIFNPFQRLHGRGVYAGTGIGLAIVKKIIERHAAHISASSQPGQGSIFRIRFPSYQKASA